LQRFYVGKPEMKPVLHLKSAPGIVLPRGWTILVLALGAWGVVFTVSGLISGLVQAG